MIRSQPGGAKGAGSCGFSTLRDRDLQAVFVQPQALEWRDEGCTKMVILIPVDGPEVR